MNTTTDTPRTDEKKWCAYCGAWGDHQSGYCVPFLRDREATLTHQLADARLDVERLKLERDHAIDMELAACAREEMQKAEVERLRAIGNLIADNAPLDFKLLLLEKFGHQLKATLNPNK